VDAYDNVARQVANAAEGKDACKVQQIMDNVAEQTSFEERRWILARVSRMTIEDHKADPSLPEFVVQLDPDRVNAEIDMNLQTRGFHLMGIGAIYHEEMDFETLKRTRVEHCK
jgi:hypothetical protein